MKIALLLWYCYVAFLLPISLCRKMAAAAREPSRPLLWRAGRVAFYMGILVWCPYVLFTRLLGVQVWLTAVIALHVLCLYGGLAAQQWAVRRLSAAAQEAPHA